MCSNTIRFPAEFLQRHGAVRRLSDQTQRVKRRSKTKINSIDRRGKNPFLPANGQILTFFSEPKEMRQKIFADEPVEPDVRAGSVSQRPERLFDRLGLVQFDTIRRVLSQFARVIFQSRMTTKIFETVVVQRQLPVNVCGNVNIRHRPAFRALPVRRRRFASLEEIVRQQNAAGIRAEQSRFHDRHVPTVEKLVPVGNLAFDRQQMFLFG